MIKTGHDYADERKGKQTRGFLFTPNLCLRGKDNKSKCKTLIFYKSLIKHDTYMCKIRPFEYKNLLDLTLKA